MSDGKDLAVMPANAIKGHVAERDRRKEILDLVDQQLRTDIDTIRLSNYAFSDEDDPAFKALSSRQRRVARAWEAPKREAAALLTSVSARVASLIRARESSEAKAHVNVENLTIHLPDKEIPAQIPAGVVIDVEPK